MAQGRYRATFLGVNKDGPRFYVAEDTEELKDYEKGYNQQFILAEGKEHAKLMLEVKYAQNPDAYLSPTRRNLNFAELRAANIARLPLFKNAKGKPAHSQRDGSDWSIGEWMNATLGELGEAANIVKKIQRGDITLAEALPSLKKEFADVQTYLDLTAYRCGIDLGVATIEKWNEVSERVGVELRL